MSQNDSHNTPCKTCYKSSHYESHTLQKALYNEQKQQNKKFKKTENNIYIEIN